MKKIILFLFLVFLAVELFADARVYLTIQNRSINGGILYADVYANPPSSSDKWLVAASTIVIKFNSNGLNLTNLDGVAIQNLDSELSSAGYSCSQTDFGTGYLAMNLFVTNPTVNKFGDFRIGTIRFNVSSSSQYDSLKFDTDQCEIFNGLSQMLEYNCNTTSCYKVTNPTPMLLQSASVPTLTTTSITNITSSTASSGGNVTSDGGASVTSRGVCWSTSQNPTVSNSKTTDGSGTGSFTSSIIGLSPNTTYYVRAYATNSVGTAYGSQISFTTSQGATIPTVSTTSITNITTTTASSGGNITSDGGSSVTSRGVCWSTSQNPTTSNSKTTDGNGTGSFNSSITGLSPNTTYYVRAYATNSVGTAYGSQVSFTTSQGATLPTLTTTSVSNISSNSASSGGNISSDGGSSVTSRGVCWSTSQNPTTADSKTTDGNGTGSFSSSITGLNPGTTYYVRAYATNSVGTAYGSQVSFTSGQSNGARVTLSISNRSINSGILYADIYANAPSSSDKWLVAASTIVIKYNVNGLNLTNLDGVAIQNLDSELSSAGYSCTQTDFGTGYLAMNLFVTNPTVNKFGDFRIGTIRFNVSSSSQYDSLKFDTDQCEIFNGLSLMLEYNCNTTSCYKVTNPTPMLLQSASVPTITTTSITNITSTIASSGGNVTSDGGASVTSRGVCWSTSQNPTTSNSKTTDGNGTGSFTSSLTGLNPGTTYYVRAYATNSNGTAYGNEVSFTSDSNQIIEPPSSWAFTDFTGSNSTVLVPKNINPKIDTRDFQKGDAVGFFFTRNGALVCAGYGVWNNVNLAVTVWGDDSETAIKDGFASNEGYTIKIWDGQLGKEMNAEFTISSGNAYYTTNGFTTLSSLKGVSTTTQAIYLKSGWNLISSYVIPTNDSLENIWRNLNNKLIITKNNGGQVYIPSYEINSIGKWKHKEAYQTYMSSADTLKVSGLAANPSNESIIINSGWNLVSYLRSSSKDITECLTTLTESNSLTIAKNNAGQVYIPSYEINSIGNMLPGQGYQMYLTKKDTLVYPANGAGRASSNSLTPMAKYILPEYTETGNSAVLLLEIEGQNGDEIAVYNQNNQVIGSGVIHKNKAALTIWGDNERTSEIDGSISSEKLKVKSYNVNTGRIIDVNLSDLVDVVTGNNIYELNYSKDAFFVAKAKVLDNNSNLSMKVNPNPASDYIEITIEGETDNTSLVLFSNEGKQIANLSSELLTLSGKKLRYNTTNLTSGTYNLILNNGTDKIIKQIMIVK